MQRSDLKGNHPWGGPKLKPYRAGAWIVGVPPPSNTQTPLPCDAMLEWGGWLFVLKNWQFEKRRKWSSADLRLVRVAQPTPPLSFENVL